jgi:hypothetical protein
MKSLLPLAAAAALFLGLSAPASAAPVKYAVVGNWEIYNNATYCTATATYEDYSSLQFNLGVSGSANIAIWNPRWDIPKGTHTVVASVDRAPPEAFRAEADGVHVMMPWTPDEDQINLVSNGAVFRAMVGREIYKFRLDGSREMLRSLGRCVAQISPSVSNPFAGTPSAKAPPSGFTEVVPLNPFPETASNPYRRM